MSYLLELFSSLGGHRIPFTDNLLYLKKVGHDSHKSTVLEVAGTVLTAQLAYHFGMAANVAGGTHHAHPQGGAV
jgi:acetoin utilization deacetylase AcuC-like enzyme